MLKPRDEFRSDWSRIGWLRAPTFYRQLNRFTSGKTKWNRLAKFWSFLRPPKIDNRLFKRSFDRCTHTKFRKSFSQQSTADRPIICDGSRKIAVREANCRRGRYFSAFRCRRTRRPWSSDRQRHQPQMDRIVQSWVARPFV